MKDNYLNLVLWRLRGSLQSKPSGAIMTQCLSVCSLTKVSKARLQTMNGNHLSGLQLWLLSTAMKCFLVVHLCQQQHMPATGTRCINALFNILIFWLLLQWKGEFNEVDHLWNLSGWGWGESTCKVTASNSVCYAHIIDFWFKESPLNEPFCQAHWSDAKCQSRAFPLYNEILQLVRGKSVMRELAFAIPKMHDSPSQSGGRGKSAKDDEYGLKTLQFQESSILQIWW